MESCTNNHPIQVKLIFNPIAGTADESPGQLLRVIKELQTWNFIPETYMVEPSSNLLRVVQEAYERGIRMFVVCGGDGTIENVAEALIDKDAILGIIPTGTRNNVALSLGVPEDISTAVALLRTGHCIKVDVGLASCGELSRYFLETCSIGLLSALFPAADDIQHGNLTRIGDLISTLVSFPSADMRLVMDTQPELHTQGHVVLVANLPYVGPHFQIAPEGSFNSGDLEVLVFSDLSKLDLLSNVAQMAGGGPEDPRIRRYQVQKIDIDTNPLMPVMADGFSLGEGSLHISIQRCALTVIAGKTISNTCQDSPSKVIESLSNPHVMVEA
jgi:diacylglycerol kinase (ATP)